MGYRNMNKPGHLLRAAICLLCCMLSAACIDELSPGSSGLSGGDGAAPAGSLLLTLQVPGIPAADDAATRAATPADECRVDPAQLHLLLFDQSGDKYVFYRYAAPENLKEVAGSNPRRYTLDVPFKAGEFNRNYRMMVVANLPLAQLTKAGGGEDFPAFRACGDRDNPVEAVRNLIARDNPGDPQTGRWPVGGTEGFTPFPMWGESAAFNARPEENIDPLSLIRAVARIDVGINFRKNADGTYPLDDMRSTGIRSNGNGRYFKLTSVSVYRIPRSAWIGPREENYNAETGTVTAPTPTGDIAEDAPRQYVETDLSTDPDATDPTDAENRRALTRTVYVPEALNRGMSHERAVCLVVGGVYGEGNTTPTFYRIDIYDRTPGADGNLPKPTPGNRLDILRNHAYVVNITSVYGPGATTEEDALQQTGNTNMEVELSDWNQDHPMGDITSDGVYSLNLSRTEQEYYSDGSPVDFTIETNYDGELGKGWQMEADEVAKQFVVFYDKAGNEITYGSPDWPAQGKIGTTHLRIGWKEFVQPPGTTVVQARQAVLTFTAGRMKVRCRLRQLSRELLRINFTPPEIGFTREPEHPQHIDIDVTTRESYQLEVSWKNEAGDNCTWSLTNPLANPVTFPDARFKAENFFAPDPAGGYRLKPENLPPDASAPRTFVFTFTATSDINGNTGASLLTVYQSILNVSWKVDGGQGPYKNEVYAAHTDQSAKVRIVTTPSNLEWYFSRPQNAGQGGWITNLDDFIGTKQTGGGNQTFNLQPNNTLGRRSYTLQARSPEGLDENHSKLILIQQGVPLELKPSLQGAPGAVTETTEADGKTLYTLDYGTALSGAAGQKIDMTSNTDWFWRWDRSSPTFDKNYRDMFGSSFSANPAENSATTDGPADGTTRKTWQGVFAFNTTESQMKSDAALWADKENVPLGGVQGITMDLRNKNVELEEEDVEANRRRFRIQRVFPSYQNIMYWPSQDSENLDMYADEIVAGTETLRVRTNATGTVECYSGADMGSMTLMGRKEIAAQQGYQEFTVPFRDLGVPVNAQSFAMPKTWVKLKYTGPKREMPDAADNPSWSAERNYFYGRVVNKPTRNMATGQRFLSNAQHQLIFDFSNSIYKKVKLRVRLETISTSYDKRGFAGTVPDTYIASIGGADGIYLEWPNTRLNVTLPAAMHENCLTKVWLEYLDEKPGVNIWKSDLSPDIYQDGLAHAGYLVYYDAYPQSMHNGWWYENPMGKSNYTWTDAKGINWIAATPLQRADVVDLSPASTAVEFAKNNSRTSCKTSVLFDITGRVYTKSKFYMTPVFKFDLITTRGTFRSTNGIEILGIEPSFPNLSIQHVGSSYTIYSATTPYIAGMPHMGKYAGSPAVIMDIDIEFDRSKWPMSTLSDNDYRPGTGWAFYMDIYFENPRPTDMQTWTDADLLGYTPIDYGQLLQIPRQFNNAYTSGMGAPPAVRRAISGVTTGTTTYPE